MVARPVAVDAAAVGAGELFGLAAAALGAGQRRRVLVGAVDAVRIAVADPLARNALRFACPIKRISVQVPGRSKDEDPDKIQVHFRMTIGSYPFLLTSL